MRAASLLLELGLFKKALDVSAQVVKSPFLRSPVLSAGVVSELCKRHCGHVLYALSLTPPPLAMSENRVALQEEVLQMCMMALQQDPSDSDVLITFASFCRHHKPDFLPTALDMLHVHFLTLLTRFEHVSHRLKGSAAFASVITSDSITAISTEVTGGGNAEQAAVSGLSLSESIRKYIHSIVEAASKETGLPGGVDDDDGEGIGDGTGSTPIRGSSADDDNKRNESHTDADGDIDNDGDDGDEDDLSTSQAGDGKGDGSFMIDVHRELRALLHWASLLRHVQHDKIGYCSLVLPLLEMCQQHALERRTGRSRKRKIRAVSVRRMWLKNGVLAYRPYSWMDNIQNSFRRMVFALCLHVPHMSTILDGESTRTMALQVSEDLSLVEDESAQEMSARWGRSFGLGSKKRTGAGVRDGKVSRRRRLMLYATNEDGDIVALPQNDVSDDEDGDDEWVDLSNIAVANKFARDMRMWTYSDDDDVFAADNRESYLSTLLKYVQQISDFIFV